MRSNTAPMDAPAPLNQDSPFITLPQSEQPGPEAWLEYNPAMIQIVGLESREIFYVNQTFLTTLGYSRNEVIGKRASELNMNYDTQLCRQFDDQIRKGESLLRVEMPIRDRQGARHDCQFTLQPIQFRGLPCVMSSMLDISRCRRAEIFLKHRTEQQEILSDVAHHLLDLDRLPTNLQRVLEQLGTHLGVSRIYIFEADDGQQSASNTFEWCNLGIRPQIGNLQGVPYSAVPSWYEILRKNGMLFSPDVRHLAADIRAILEPQGIKSILVYELQVFQRFHGFIGYDECVQKREWLKDDIEFLRVLSGLISTAFERRAYRKLLKQHPAT